MYRLGGFLGFWFVRGFFIPEKSNYIKPSITPLKITYTYQVWFSILVCKTGLFNSLYRHNYFLRTVEEKAIYCEKWSCPLAHCLARTNHPLRGLLYSVSRPLCYIQGVFQLSLLIRPVRREDCSWQFFLISYGNRTKISLLVSN